jgi:hypothetical protein
VFVRLKTEFGRLVAEAVTEKSPAIVFDENAGAVAKPLVFVTTVEVEAKVPVAPVEGAVKTTDTPPTGLPYVSCAWTLSCLGKAEPTVANWLLPSTIEIAVAVSAVLVITNINGETPLDEAVMSYTPAKVFAVKTGEDATPLPLVVTVEDAEKLPLAPVEGTEKVTLASGTKLP